ncbi:MAG: hypothetical protein E7661_00500 [Ruminococcaceae bacterium]|nr:hypothetical protein [Oscillospiraceae bacterium]
MANVNISVFTPSRGKRVRKGIANAFLGLLVIAVGVGYLGNYLDFCPWQNFTLFFPGWGSLFLIVPALYFFIRRPTSIFWPVIFLVGVLILLSNQQNFEFGKAAAIVLAVAIIFVGLRILLSPLFRRVKRRKREKFSTVTTHADGANTYSVRFGERTVVVDGQAFSSATLNAAFGQLNLDLRGALIEDPAVIDARCSFGEIDILLPPDVKVELNPSAAFGEVSNRHTDSSDPTAPTLYINADCSFGEISIK